jgi:hypothetical protein
MWRKLSTPSACAVFAVLMICGCGNHDALVNAVDKDLTAQKVRYDGPRRVDAAALAADASVPELTCERQGGLWVCGPFCPYDCATWERACRRAAVFHRTRDYAVCDSCDEDDCR